MSELKKKENSLVNGKFIFLNLLSFSFIFACLLLFRAPLLFNADHYLSFDEAYQGSQILDLMNGGPIQFYYEGESYAGIFLGLAAIPFFWLFGVSAFSYKIPAIIVYSLYILSSYWVAKKINPTAAVIVVILMIFAPPCILSISSSNWPHNLIVFLGNVMILLFYKYKESEDPEGGVVFLLGVTIGFSIYSYTYSILYIASIGLLLVLTHKHWQKLRGQLSVRGLQNWWAKKTTRCSKFIGVLDGVIIVFIGAILFSYIFGGFGIDIAGYSIFQINNLHKPVGQLFILVIIRLLIQREDIGYKMRKENFLEILEKIESIRIIAFGALGVILGILPRFASIIIGETTRGGQGFDVDFNPLKLFSHLWDLVISILPEFFNIREPIVNFFTSEWSSEVLVRGCFALVITFMLVRSIISFYGARTEKIKHLIQLKYQKFSPDLVLIVLPVAICSAVVIIQNGALLRYLLPMHGLVAIWVAIYLIEVRRKSQLIFWGLLFVWCAFSLQNIGNYYFELENKNENSKAQIIGDFSISEIENPYLELVEYCNSKNISNVYSDMITAAQINFFGHGRVIAGVYDQGKESRRKNQVLSMESNFSIIISKTKVKHLKFYKKFIEKTSVKFSQKLVNEEFWVLTDFNGSPDEINFLRNLIPVNF